MRAVFFLFFLILLAACGRRGFDPSGDAGISPDVGLDAPAAGCAVPEITAVATTANVGGSSVFAGSCGGATAPELVVPFDVPAVHGRLPRQDLPTRHRARVRFR